MDKEKKEIGKLLELLNEYENRDDDQQIEWRVGEGDKGERGKVRGIVNEVYMGWVSELVVCSANYGFIKWLVENDKIDRDKVKRESRKFFVGDLRPRTPRYKLLILLSISDTPIEDLLLYLKQKSEWKK